jgi:hypothetical protein
MSLNKAITDPKRLCATHSLTLVTCPIAALGCCCLHLKAQAIGSEEVGSFVLSFCRCDKHFHQKPLWRLKALRRLYKSQSVRKKNNQVRDSEQKLEAEVMWECSCSFILAQLSYMPESCCPGTGATHSGWIIPSVNLINTLPNMHTQKPDNPCQGCLEGRLPGDSRSSQ